MSTERRLKYQSNLECAENCPPTRECLEGPFYRWVHEESEHHKYDFLPVFLINPARIPEDDDEEYCKGFGLSVYNTAKQAENKLLGLIKVRKNPQKIIDEKGNWIAKIVPLSTPIGFTDGPAPDGHITLHPFEDVDLRALSTWVKEIC